MDYIYHRKINIIIPKHEIIAMMFIYNTQGELLKNRQDPYDSSQETCSLYVSWILDEV